MEKKILRKMYCEEKRSAVEIAAALNTTTPRIIYWLRKYEIPTRSHSDRIYLKLNPMGDPFSPKANLSEQESKLLLLGLALYWAEGSKKSPFAVRLANLDPRMLQLFMRFLREIVCVEESRLRVDVRVFKDFDLRIARRYWSRKLLLSPKRVFVYPHTDTRSRVNKQWSKYGIATVSASSTKLKIWVDEKLENFVAELLSDLREVSDGGNSLIRDRFSGRAYAA